MNAGRYRDGQGRLRYDVRHFQWMVDVPLAEHTVTFPLGVRGRRNRDEAEGKLAEFLFADAPPLALEPSKEQPVVVRFDTDRDRWVVDVSCRRCGGYALELRASDPLRAGSARLEAARLRRMWAESPCCGCVTHKMRHGRRPAAVSASGAVQWFDCVTQQWTITTRVDARVEASLPLGLDALAEVGDLVEKAREIGFLAGTA